MDDILISVIVPIYNTSKYLDRCMQSIISQTVKNIEIILIDDGSTDNSLAICKEYEKMYKNIRVYHQKNLGQGAARNIGIVKARGKYIGFVDSDDYIDKNMYKYMLGLAENNELDIVCCKYERVFSNEDVFKAIEINKTNKLKVGKENLIKSFLLNEISASPCDKVFRKEFLLNNNIMFPEGSYYEDIYMILSSVYYSNTLILNETAFYKYFKRINSTTLLSDERHLSDLYKQIKNCYNFIYKNYDYKKFSIELKSSKFLYNNMILKLLKDLNKEIKAERFFEKLPKKLIIFGASAAGGLIKYFCDIFNIEVLFFCDNSEPKWGNKLEQKTIIQPKQLLNLVNMEYGIYIASMHYKEIYIQLSEFGLDNKIVDIDIF